MLFSVDEKSLDSLIKVHQFQMWILQMKTWTSAGMLSTLTIPIELRQSEIARLNATQRRTIMFLHMQTNQSIILIMLNEIAENKLYQVKYLFMGPLF